MSDLFWTPDRQRTVELLWKREINSIQPEVVIQFICKHTGMKHVSSQRQLLNGTLVFRDEEFNESYGLYLSSGYVRRWGRYINMYQLNETKQLDKYTKIRVTYPFDAHKMAQRIIRAHAIRHERNYVGDTGFVWPLLRCQWGTDPLGQREEWDI